MNLATMFHPRTRTGAHRHPADRRSVHRRSVHRGPGGFGRPALVLAVAGSAAVMANVLTAGQPAAHAGTGSGEPVSVATQLGLTGSVSTPSAAAVRPLEGLGASRSEREGVQQAVTSVQAPDTPALQALAAAGQAQSDAAAKAAAEAAAQAAAQAAADAAAQAAAQAATAARNATPSSFQAYALSKLGGDASQMSCLENLWGKESGWNPNAHNPSSSAYGIPQFLDSTWAGTGIARTSDGYRQIDAGLVYIDSRYGSPCGAWAHSRSSNWY